MLEETIMHNGPPQPTGAVRSLGAVPPLIICDCFGITKSALVKLIDEGASSLPEIARRCGAGSDCGSCQKSIREILTHHLKSKEKECLLVTHAMGK